jgi:quercetin dioxygenase-like cupin family protein
VVDSPARPRTPWGIDRRGEDRNVTPARAVGMAVCSLALATVALAQTQGVKRTVLQRADVVGPEAKECVFGMADIEPGQSVGKHIHHGFEVGFVAQGELDLMVEGEEVRHLKAGDSYRVEVRRPHDARNVGSTPVRVVASWVVEKGKPLAEPVK